MKANAKLNAVAKATKYKMHNMIFDDLLDLTGIDTSKSSGYTHNATLGEITSKSNECVIKTTVEESSSIPKKAIFTLDQESENTYFESKSGAEGGSRIGRRGTIQVIVPGQSFTPSTDILLTSIEIFAQYAEGTPGDIIVNIYDNVVDPSLQTPIASGIIPSFRDTTPSFREAKMIQPITLKKDKTYLIACFTETPSVSNSMHNYIWIATNNITINQGSFYVKYFDYPWTRNESIEGVIKINGIFKNERNKLNSFISRNAGETWEQIIPDTLFYFNDNFSPKDSKLKLKIELPSGTKLLNYALTWV